MIVITTAHVNSHYY